MEHIGDRIRNIRIKNKLTLQELGDKLNYNYSNLSKIERGDRKPTIELLESLSEMFDVPVSHFFGEEQQLPEKLKRKGAEWLVFGEEMEKRDLTPEEIKGLIDLMDKLRQ